MRFILGKCILVWSIERTLRWILGTSGLIAITNLSFNGLNTYGFWGNNNPWCIKIHLSLSVSVFFVSRTCTLYIMYSANHIKGVNGIRTICELSVIRALKVP